jgi:mannose-6-phosphate isomerase-like protein (cupin superfamily)
MHDPMKFVSATVAFFAFAGCAAAGDNIDLATKIDTGSAEHYRWAGDNDGWYMVKREDMSVIQERMAPGSEEMSHYHKKARQFFYVLKGTLTIQADGYANIVNAGQGIEIEPGKAHQARNLTDEPVDFIVTSMPNSHGDMVAAPAEFQNGKKQRYAARDEQDGAEAGQ